MLMINEITIEVNNYYYVHMNTVESHLDILCDEYLIVGIVNSLL